MGSTGRWNASGATAMLHDRLRTQARLAAGRHPTPSAAIIDSQSLRAADTVPKASRGYDAAKKVNGRKRHLAVDPLGLLLAIVVVTVSAGSRSRGRPVVRVRPG
jgi:transposase